MMETWLQRFVGIPYMDGGRTLHGCDCYGLIRLALAHRFAVILPAYADAPAEPDGRAAAFLGAAADGPWRPVYPAEAKLGDVILLNLAGQPIHCGLVVDDGLMLHTMRGRDAVVERFHGPIWEPRIAGFFRHRELEVPCGASIS